MKGLGLTIALCLLMNVFYSCEKSNDNKDNVFTNKKGTVKYSGDIAADGCGWLINIDGIDYKLS